MKQWSVCLPEHHPGYVSWDEYLQTRERLRANMRPRGEGGGAAREGAALLQGLLRCGRCGRRMQVAYSGTRRPRRAVCVRARPHLHGTEQPASRSAAGAWTRRSPPRSSRPSRRPGSRDLGGDRASSSDQHDERLAGQRLARRTRRVRSRPRAPPVRRLRAREPPRRPHPGTHSSRTRSPSVERERAQARRARTRAGPRRSPTTSAARWRGSRAICRGCGPPRRRPTATARSCCAPSSARSSSPCGAPTSAPTSRSSGKAAPAAS